MTLELIDDEGRAIQAEGVEDDLLLHVTTDLMGGDGVRLTREQVDKLAAFLASWLAAPLL